MRNGRASLASYVVFDIETTGLEPTSDAIIEIGAVRVRNGEKETFQALLQPRIPIPQEAFQTHGISTEEASGKGQHPKFALKTFLAFIQDLPLVAHNGIRFDFPFLAHELSRYKIDVPHNLLIDTLPIAKIRLRSECESFNLETICHQLKIQNPDSHRALSDAKACHEVFCRIAASESDLDTLWAQSYGYTLNNVIAVPENMDLLRKAITQNKELCIAYIRKGDEEPRERWIKPEGVIPSPGAFPAIRALCLEDQVKKTFRLDRVKKLVGVR